MPNTEAFRQHKRRQRHRNQERRQVALDELLARIPPISTSPLVCNDDQVMGIYKPIPSLTTPESFWIRVPNACNPNTAMMDSKIVADKKKFAGDKNQLDKLQRKLVYRTERGDITKEEQEELWKQHGRMTKDHGQEEDSENGTTSEDFPITLLSASRGQRKAWQVENFVALLQGKLQPGMTVIDFGSGSGNLCLALAAYFPDVRFVLVDKKPYPLKLVQNRADDAGLRNIQAQQYTFSPDNLESYEPPQAPSISDEAETGSDKKTFDLGIGLHCCGSFTDMVMELCRSHQADCIVCPCCNGGMVSKATGGYNYPRSSFMQECMTEEEYLQQLSRSADDLQNYAAKCYIEYDRALWARENGFPTVELWKMTPVECTPKHHVLYLRK